MEGPVLSHGPNGVVDGKEPNGWARLGPPDRRPKAGGHPRQALLHLGQVRQRAEEVPGALVLLVSELGVSLDEMGNVENCRPPLAHGSKRGAVPS
jgi:hypothetical protein